MKDTEFLSAVEEKISSALSDNDGELPQSQELLNRAAQHLCLTQNAKRARPLLALYFSQSIPIDDRRLLDIAVAAELIHSASLLHDDVIDNAETRRGRMTANVHFSNTIAVLTGNYLLSVAFLRLRGCPESLTSDAVEAIAYMTKAAIAEIEVRGSLDINIQIWRSIAAGKTGALFAWIGQAVAHLAGDEEVAERFRKCGFHVGAAFQMVDDLRDLQDTNQLKDRFSDLFNREPSLPILLAASESPLVKKAIEALWRHENMNPADVARVGQLLIETRAVERTLALVKEELRLAKLSLGPFAGSEGGQKLIFWAEQLEQAAASGFLQEFEPQISQEAHLAQFIQCHVQ